MTISFIQKNANTTASGTSGTCPAWSVSPTAGNLLLIFINELGAFTGTWSGTPSGYTAYSPTPFIYYTTPADPYGIYWKIATGGDATPGAIGVDGGTAGPWIIYTYEYASTTGWETTPNDAEAHSAATATATTTKATGSTATLASTDELGIAILATSVAITSVSVTGSGFGLNNPTTGADSRLQVAQVANSGVNTALSTTFNWTTSARAGARIATFKAGAPAAVTRSLASTGVGK